MHSCSRTYRLSPLAEADLEEIWLYTFQTWSLEQAEHYIRSIISAFEGLISGELIAQCSDIREGYWKYRVGMHVIYFLNSGKYLDIIRILHGHMDVDKHLRGDN